ncbi:MAG: hypothetical protein ACM3MG_07040 [Bacillota bacterium]
MKAIKVMITAAVITIASTSLAATKCSQRFASNGNSLLQNTVAPSSSADKTHPSTVASAKGTR